MIAFGDATADLGQVDLGQNRKRYTINDGTINIWTEFVADKFGRPLVASVNGGLSFAFGNARVVAKPDAAGNNATPTVAEQIDAFLAKDAPGPNDLVLVSAGTSDVIVQARAVLDGTLTEAEAMANAEQAARDLGAQVRRLVNAGARHVVVMGPYNLGRSPWAAQTGQAAFLQRISSVSGTTGAGQARAFNERLLISMVDLGDNVLYVDAALEVNLITANPGSSGFNLSDASTTICNSVDPGPGIGTGANQVNSHLCTPSTLIANADQAKFLFADRIYLTPRGQQLLGDFAFGRIRQRW